ncbi:MAG TPA: P-loop NTPase fold protein, partial [Patescibacteria group bacterium]
MQNSQSRDQKVIEEFLQEETSLFKNFSSDADFISFFVDTLIDVKQKNTTIVSVTGGPGSGKSTFVKHVIDELKKKNILADSVTTEDFNLLDRTTRDKLIASGASPLDFKNFQHLNTLLAKIKAG